MNITRFTASCAAIVHLLISFHVYATSETEAVKLSYLEMEQGIEPYRVTYTVADRFIRIDDESDATGFIVYDIAQNRIYSVSHHSKTTLVIPKYQAEEFKPAFEIDIEYGKLDDAPGIAGKAVYNYRVRAVSGENDETCLDIQLVPGLMPEVAGSLQRFQQVVSANQVNSLDSTPEEFRSPCYLVGLVYNDGAYYSKGLPIQEWYSNGRRRQLVNYENVSVDETLFDIPSDYRQYSPGSVR